MCTLCKGGDGAPRFDLALQEAMLWLCGDLVNQLPVISVWIHGQQLLLRDQVGGLVDIDTRHILTDVLMLQPPKLNNLLVK